jgi:hypothetical protein
VAGGRNMPASASVIGSVRREWPPIGVPRPLTT